MRRTAFALSLAICSLAAAQPALPRIHRGDLNADRSVDMSDLRLMLDWIASPPHDNAMLDRADLNSDGRVDEQDLTRLVQVLGTHPPCASPALCCTEIWPFGCCGAPSGECSSGGPGSGGGGPGGGGPGGIGADDPGDVPGPGDPPQNPCDYTLAVLDAEQHVVHLGEVVTGARVEALSGIAVHAFRDINALIPQHVTAVWTLFDADDPATPIHGPVAGGSYTVNVGPGIYYLRTECNINPPSNPRQITVAICAMQPKSVSFGGANHLIHPDNPADAEPFNQPYADYHWYGANADGAANNQTAINDPAAHHGFTKERRLPVAYTRNTPLTITRFEPHINTGEAITGGPNPGPTGFTYRAVHDRGGPDETVFTSADPSAPAVGDHPLPNHIDYNPIYTLEWEVSFDGQHLWFPIGTTTHEVYVTLDTPTGQRLESMYHIAVTSATGETTTQGALNATWAKFATRSVQNKRGDTLAYYRGAGCPTTTATTARRLLIDQDGQCGAWVQLFGNCARIHSPQAVRQIIVQPNPTQFNYECDAVLGANNAWHSSLSIMINNWISVHEPSSGCPTFPYRINSACLDWQEWSSADVDDAAGASAQDQPNPISIFSRHVLVKIGAHYYDPSYGTDYDSHLDWENNSVAGFAARINNNHHRRGAVPDNPQWPETFEAESDLSPEIE